MDKALFRSIVPYAVGLAIAIALYIYAGTFDYTPRPGQLGPEVWPRLAILLMGASCVFEISRRLDCRQSGCHRLSGGIRPGAGVEETSSRSIHVS